MKTKIMIAIYISMLIIACNKNNNQNKEKDSDCIQISKAQFESEKMTIGEPVLYPSPVKFILLAQLFQPLTRKFK